MMSDKSGTMVRQDDGLVLRRCRQGSRNSLRAASAEFAKPGEPDMSRIIEVGAEHGIHCVHA